MSKPFQTEEVIIVDDYVNSNKNKPCYQCKRFKKGCDCAPESLMRRFSF
jgi:hypothetical protein